MPPRQKLSRNEIITAARQLIRERGIEGLNARDLGTALGISTRPIYGHFASMDELRDLILNEILAEYFAFLIQDQGTGKPILDIGLAEVRFARTRPVEYRLLRYPLVLKGEGSQPRTVMDGLLDHLAKGKAASADRQALSEKLLPLAIFAHGLADLLSRGFRPDMTDAQVIELLQTFGQAVAQTPTKSITPTR